MRSLRQYHRANHCQALALARLCRHHGSLHAAWLAQAAIYRFYFQQMCEERSFNE